MAQNSTLVAVVATPNPVASTLPNTLWQSQNVQSSHTTSSSNDPKYKMSDLKSVVLDIAGARPMINGSMMSGMYIPVKYIVTTAKENIELKSFRYAFAEPIRMNLPISKGMKDAKDADAQTPKAVFTLYDDKNRTSLDEIAYLEAKFNETLKINGDAIRKQRQLLVQQFYKAPTVKPIPVDKRDSELISIIKSKPGVDKTTNAEVTYRNLEVKLNEPDPATPKNPNSKWTPPPLLFGLFQSTNTDDYIQRNNKNEIVNGRQLTVQQMIDEKIDKLSAVPVLAFGELYFMFNPSFYGIRLKRFIRSCDLIQPPKFKLEQRFGQGANTYTSNEFAKMPTLLEGNVESKKDGDDEPAPKRARLDGNEVSTGNGMPFVVQPQSQNLNATPSLMDMDEGMDIRVFAK